MTTTTHLHLDGVEQSLEAAGFRRAEGASYVRRGVVARIEQRWLSFRSPVNRGVHDPLSAGQRLALWKPVPAATDAVAAWEFHLPLSLFSAADDALPINEEDELNPFEAGIQWVLAAAGGKLPGDWQPPPEYQVDSWIPAGHLSVRAGPFVCQGSVLHRPDRLTLSFPLVHGSIDRLSDARRDWLRDVLLDAQRRWRMVRIVLNEQGQPPAVSIAVDLSGAPPAILEDLFRTSLDALRWAVGLLLCPVGFLSEPSVTCEAWDTLPADLFKKEK